MMYANLPSPLNAIVGKFETAVWYVQKFEVHIKGEQAQMDKTQFSCGYERNLWKTRSLWSGH